MRETQDNRKRNLIRFIIVLAIIIILVPLFTLANSGIPNKGLGFKLMVYETTPLSLGKRPCNNPAASPLEIIFTYVYDMDYKIVCGAKGNPLVMASNKKAIDPTWEELAEFLRCDDTDKHRYDENLFNCADYAEMVQNNAARAGWRAGFVGIQLRENSTGKQSGHAINAFQTTDHGLVYIDCIRYENSIGYHADKLVQLEINRKYQAGYIFPSKIWPLFLDYPNNYTVVTIDMVNWPANN